MGGETRPVPTWFAEDRQPGASLPRKMVRGLRYACAGALALFCPLSPLPNAKAPQGPKRCKGALCEPPIAGSPWRARANACLPNAQADAVAQTVRGAVRAAAIRAHVRADFLADTLLVACKVPPKRTHDALVDNLVLLRVLLVLESEAMCMMLLESQ